MAHIDPGFIRPEAPFRIAFIGGGLNSAVGRAHFNAIRLDGVFHLVAGCFSRDPEINRQSAKYYGVQPKCTYAHYEDLLACEPQALDAVVVLTPTSDHTAPVSAALNAGVPVICEKALASNLDDIQTIIDAERRTSGFLAVTYNYTGYPALRELRAWIQAGRLGKILHFVAEMPQEGFLRIGSDGQPLKPQKWRLQDGSIPTVYLDLGVHLHQIQYYLLGHQPVRGVAFHHAYGNFPDVIDYVNASVEFDQGVHGVFYFGKSMLGYRNGLRIRINGSTASVEWEQMRPEELRIAHADGRVEILDRGGRALISNQARYTRFKAGHPAGYIEAFANLYVDISEALSHYRQAGTWQSNEVYGSAISMQGLQLLAEMAESARTRQLLDMRKLQEQC